MSYLLKSRARPRLDAPDFGEHQPRDLTGHADTYDAALEHLQEQVPAGWVLLGLDFVERGAD